MFVSSEVPIFDIFSDDSNTGPGARASDHMRALMDELVRAANSSTICLALTIACHCFCFRVQGLPAEVVGAASMFNGEEELFAFARCCSRLVQMGSAEWMEHAGRR